MGGGVGLGEHGSEEPVVVPAKPTHGPVSRNCLQLPQSLEIRGIHSEECEVVKRRKDYAGGVWPGWVKQRLWWTSLEGPQVASRLGSEVGEPIFACPSPSPHVCYQQTPMLTFNKVYARVEPMSHGAGPLVCRGAGP